MQRPASARSGALPARPPSSTRGGSTTQQARPVRKKATAASSSASSATAAAAGALASPSLGDLLPFQRQFMGIRNRLLSEAATPTTTTSVAATTTTTTAEKITTATPTMKAAAVAITTATRPASPSATQHAARPASTIIIAPPSMRTPAAGHPLPVFNDFAPFHCRALLRPPDSMETLGRPFTIEGQKTANMAIVSYLLLDAAKQQEELVPDAAVAFVAAPPPPHSRQPKQQHQQEQPEASPAQFGLPASCKTRAALVTRLYYAILGDGDGALITVHMFKQFCADCGLLSSGLSLATVGMMFNSLARPQVGLTLSAFATALFFLAEALAPIAVMEKAAAGALTCPPAATPPPQPPQQQQRGRRMSSTLR